MPIYEYECNECSKITEAFQKFSDPPLTGCPHCNGKLHKLMSLNSFHLKGSGWYVTDYAGKRAIGQSSADTGDDATKDNTPAKSEKGDVGTKSSSES